MQTCSQPNLGSWKSLSERGEKIARESVDDAIKLAFVGKYTSLLDAYQSVFKAIDHAAMEMERQIEVTLYLPNLVWCTIYHSDCRIEASDLETVVQSEDAHMANAPDQTKHKEAWEHLLCACTRRARRPRHRGQGHK